jgi:hypothetical protein
MTNLANHVDEQPTRTPGGRASIAVLVGLAAVTFSPLYSPDPTT